jgi:DNA-directed RNA polymerase subunit L
MEVKILKNEAQEISFELIGADPSLPQLLVEKLNADKSVEFAAYKVDHPIIASPIVIVKTKKEKAKDTVIRALKLVAQDMEDFKKSFLEIVG